MMMGRCWPGIIAGALFKNIYVSMWSNGEYHRWKFFISLFWIIGIIQAQSFYLQANGRATATVWTTSVQPYNNGTFYSTLSFVGMETVWYRKFVRYISNLWLIFVPVRQIFLMLFLDWLCCIIEQKKARFYCLGACSWCVHHWIWKVYKIYEVLLLLSVINGRVCDFAMVCVDIFGPFVSPIVIEDSFTWHSAFGQSFN